MQENITVDGS